MSRFARDFGSVVSATQQPNQKWRDNENKNGTNRMSISNSEIFFFVQRKESKMQNIANND